MEPDERRIPRELASYSLTVEQYEALLASQGNACAICRRSFRTRMNQIDHDHSCCSGISGGGGTDLAARRSRQAPLLRAGSGSGRLTPRTTIRGFVVAMRLTLTVLHGGGTIAASTPEPERFRDETPSRSVSSSDRDPRWSGRSSPSGPSLHRHGHSYVERGCRAVCPGAGHHRH